MAPLGVIDNSRRAAYGYDQRVEVFGSLEWAADENDGDTTVRVSTVDGVVSDKPQFFFLERYMGSFIAERSSSSMPFRPMARCRWAFMRA